MANSKFRQFFVARFNTAKSIWLNEFVAPVKSVKIAYLPPLMIYFAAGISGLTGVVASFILTKVLGLEAYFLAIIGFWAGIWWGFKMPLGHLVDLFWKFKAFFVFLGASLMAASIGIMIGLTGYYDAMIKVMSAESWYIISALASSLAFVLQDIVADALTVEAIPRFTPEGTPLDEKVLKKDHITMQLLGRAAMLFGGLIVAGAGGWFARMPAVETGLILSKITFGICVLIGSIIFLRILIPYSRTHLWKALLSGLLIAYLFACGYLVTIRELCEPILKIVLVNVKPYEMVYWLAMLVPAISVTGVLIAGLFKRRRKKAMLVKGFSLTQVKAMLSPEESEKTRINWWILGGSAVYLAILIPLGLISLTAKRGFEKIPIFNYDISTLPQWFTQNADAVLLFGSLAIVSFLIAKLIKELPRDGKRILVGTAIFIFVFRATPSIGAGLSFFYIEILKVSESFFGTIGQIGSIFGLLGLFVLRPMMATKSIAWICLFLTFFYSFFFLPIIGLVHGFHAWLAGILGTDPLATARGIILIDVVIESPFGQLAMVPMLAWIAQYAPTKHKATYFAVMASFTNLALSASTMGTKYLNEIFVITKPVFNRAGEIIKAGSYTELPYILWTVFGISLTFPVLAILLFAKLKGNEPLWFKGVDIIKTKIVNWCRKNRDLIINASVYIPLGFLIFTALWLIRIIRLRG
ncbi:hypothetical protein ACFLY5_01135 [Patescibacteria group bacterium]